jgi:hypothetical protein
VDSIFIHQVNAVDNPGRFKQQHIGQMLATAFPNPQAYTCSVLAYVRSHGQMIVEVVEIPADAYRPMYLELETVWYFEGPLRWQGIDFRIASSQECQALLNTGWMAMPDHVDEFVRQHVLLVLERPGFQVRILAANCIISNKAPAIQISRS